MLSRELRTGTLDKPGKPLQMFPRIAGPRF
jgi:hypothetical protein